MPVVIDATMLRGFLCAIGCPDIAYSEEEAVAYLHRVYEDPENYAKFISAFRALILDGSLTWSQKCWEYVEVDADNETAAENHFRRMWGMATSNSPWPLDPPAANR